MIETLLQQYPHLTPRPKTAFETEIGNRLDVTWCEQRARINVTGEGKGRKYLLRVDAVHSAYRDQELALTDDELDAVLTLLIAARDAERKGAKA